MEKIEQLASTQKVALDHLTINYSNLKKTNAEYLEKITTLQNLVNKKIDEFCGTVISKDNPTQAKDNDNYLWFVIDNILSCLSGGLLDSTQFKSFLIDRGLHYVFGKTTRKSILTLGQTLSITPGKIAKNINLGGILSKIGSGASFGLQTVKTAGIRAKGYFY